MVNTQYSQYGSLLERTRKTIVQIIAGQQSIGTGFVVSSDGMILTCNHVVAIPPPNGNPADWRYHQQVLVVMQDGSRESATIVGTFSTERLLRDYALLKIGRKTPDYLELADFSDLKIGDDLIAWGFPFGLPGPVLIKASVATTLDETANNVHIRALVFQGPTNKGMSGAPVILNRTGRVVGITSNRIAGIGKELDETSKQIRSTQGGPISIRTLGVDQNGAILGLIETLDKFLMSGMGVAISVDHVRGELSQKK